MRKTKKRSGGVHLWSVEGDMTIYRAAELKASLLQALGEVDALDIDLAKISEMDSAGVQVLIAADRLARAQNKTLRFVRHSEVAQQTIAEMNLDAQLGAAES